MFLRYEAQDAVQSHQEADVQVFHALPRYIHALKYVSIVKVSFAGFCLPLHACLV